MAVMTKGNFSIDIGFVKLGGDFTEDDRQCAWELYSELATRVAVTGKPKDPDCNDFTGEVYVESLASLHTFFGEARKIMRQFPVGSLNAKVAVGTPVTRCPPHRSVRAALPHTAPASGHDAKAGYGEGMLRYLPWVRQVMAGDGV
jgi:hypothetical protein